MKKAPWCFIVGAFLWNTGQADAQFTTIINAPPTVVASGQSIGPNTQLNVLPGGFVGSSFSAGAADGSSTNVEMNISGGSVGSNLSANHGSTINVSGGSVFSFVANNGSVVNISGGRIVSPFNANSGSLVNVSGGEIGWNSNANDGSVVNLTGGSLGNFFNANSGSIVNILGGSAGSSFDANSGSVVNVSGGSVGDFFRIFSGSEVVITGGELEGFGAENGSVVSVSGGSIRLSAITHGMTNISGGTFGNGFGASTGSVVNISAGSFGDNFKISNTAVVTITGGTIGHGLLALSGSELNISGGSFGDGFAIGAGTELNLFGGDYRINGTPIAGLGTVGDTLAVNIPQSSSVFSGTLADGTPFAFAYFDELDGIADGTLTLTTTALSPINTTVIVTPTDPPPRGVRNGQTLIVADGGTLGDHFNAGWGSTVNIVGGEVGANFEAVGSHINISGGIVKGGFDAFYDSVVNISGGTIFGLGVSKGCEVNLSGGATGDAFGYSLGGIDIEMNVNGGDFRLDGEPIAALGGVGESMHIQLSAYSVLSGTLADGTPFAFNALESDMGFQGGFNLNVVALPPIESTLIRTPTDPAPLGARTGQTVIVENGGLLGDNFHADWGSVVQINSGQVGINFEAVGAQVTISGGEVGSGVDVYYGSVFNITGGSVGSDFAVHDGGVVNISGSALVNGISAGLFFGGVTSEVNITGGTVGVINAENGSIINIHGGTVSEPNLFSGSQVNIFGGTIGSPFFTGPQLIASSGSELNISGGTLNGNLYAFPDAIVNLTGSVFVLDGIDITGMLSEEAPFRIEDRDVTLSGVLADGTPFSFELESMFGVFRSDYIDPNATLTVTLSGVALPGDYNQNGVVDAADYTVWRDTLSQMGVDLAADGNGNGTIDTGDYDVWKLHFGQTAGRGSGVNAIDATPEPTTSVLLILAGFGSCLRRRRTTK